MVISDVILFRDGGTITILVSDDPKAGAYTLPTPYHSEPRSIYWNETPPDDYDYRKGKELAIGSLEEAEFLAKLKAWWHLYLTDEIRDDLAYLEGLAEWRNLPERLDKAVTFYRIRRVIEYLAKRDVEQ
jgi:hypothetical protein